MEISLIIITKMIGIMATVVINSSTLDTNMTIEVEAIKVAECTKILFKTIVTIMMMRVIWIMHHIKLLTTLLVCRHSINNQRIEAVTTQEVTNIKVHNKFNSTE